MDLSGLDTSIVENMSGMFANTSFKTLNLSGFNTSKVIDMHFMFFDCETEDNKLDLTSFNTKNVEDMNGIFSYSRIENIDLSSFDTSNVCYVMNMFDHSNIKEINLNNFDTRKFKRMDNMFLDCKNLNKLDISKFLINNECNYTNFIKGINQNAKIKIPKEFEVKKVNDELVFKKI